LRYEIFVGDVQLKKIGKSINGFVKGDVAECQEREICIQYAYRLKAE